MHQIAVEAVSTKRLVLDPIAVEHAAEMLDVLSDAVLYTFTGGQPPTILELTERYTRQIVGGPLDGTERWLNWIIRAKETDAAMGFVQATVHQFDQPPVAEISWVIGPDFQGERFVTEAAQAIIDWLISRDVSRFLAHIHPKHHASIAVAGHLGMRPSNQMQNGEVQWRSF